MEANEVKHCSICEKVMRDGHEEPLGLDTDCGGDCWECVRAAERNVTTNEVKDRVQNYYALMLKKFDELQRRERLPSEPSILDIPVDERRLQGLADSQEGEHGG